MGFKNAHVSKFLVFLLKTCFLCGYNKVDEGKELEELEEEGIITFKNTCSQILEVIRLISLHRSQWKPFPKRRWWMRNFDFPIWINELHRVQAPDNSSQHSITGCEIRGLTAHIFAAGTYLREYLKSEWGAMN
jgi:hypothetical protein